MSVYFMHKNVWSLVLVMVASFLGTFSFRLSVPVVAFYARLVLEASAFSVGALMSVFFAFRAVGSVVAGRVFRERALFLAVVCFCVAAVLIPLYGIVGNVVLLMLLRAVHGLVLGFAWTTVQVIVGYIAPSGLRGTVYALYFAVGALAFPTADYVYSLLAYAPREVPLLLASFLMCVTAGLVALVKFPKEGEEKPRQRRRRETSAPLVLLVLFVFFTRLVSAFTMSDIIYILLKEWLSLTRSLAAQLLALMSGIGVAVSLPINFLADKLSDRIAILTVGLLMSLGILLFGLSIGTCCLGLALLIIGARCLVPLSRRLAIAQRGARGVGYVSAAGNIGTVLSSLIVGALYNIIRQAHTLTLSLAALAAITILLISILLSIKISTSTSGK